METIKIIFELFKEAAKEVNEIIDTIVEAIYDKAVYVFDKIRGD